MKMVKHCHEESSNMDLAQGALLGLVVDKCKSFGIYKPVAIALHKAWGQILSSGV